MNKSPLKFISSEVFRSVQERDRERIGQDMAWLAKWGFEAGKMASRRSFAGVSDLFDWMDGTVSSRPIHYLQGGEVSSLVELSEKKNKAILEHFEPGTTSSYRYRQIDEYNAVDYIFQHVYPVPSRQEAQWVLDFGAGYGRQANLWSQMQPNARMVVVDAPEISYCLQSLYYSAMDWPVNEYVEKPEQFEIQDVRGIQHVPTWRCDLIPDNCFDMVFCIQVLPELDARLLEYVLHTIQRVLKPGGALYLRDHDTLWKPAHKLNVNALLRDMGFVLEWRPYVSDAAWQRKNADVWHDIHGVPRIWRKYDPKTQPPPTGFRGSSEQALGRGIRRFVGKARRILRK